MKDILEIAKENIFSAIKGKYIHNDHIELFFKSLDSRFEIMIEGQSVENRNIYSLNFGKGKINVLMWSQMHGDEPTSTRGLIDYINYVSKNEKEYEYLNTNFVFKIIFILNPDGAFAYTRENSVGIDLNRDAFHITQPESKVLRSVFESFSPNYNFNLHDQRSIHGIIQYGTPATMSFLTAAYDETRAFNSVRKEAARIICGIKDGLTPYIPEQIGRFDDSFNINCTGEYFTHKGIPTILFECGHYQNDYEREKVRCFMFVALKSAIYKITENDVVDDYELKYLQIYQNNKYFVDFCFKNVKIIANNVEKIITFAIQYKETLSNNKIEFIPLVCFLGNGDNYLKGHFEMDYEVKLINNNGKNTIDLDDDMSDFLARHKII